jgi:hypothetical protein
MNLAGIKNQKSEKADYLDVINWGQIDEGECEFKVTKAEPCFSGAGNEQICLHILLTDMRGISTKIRDWLVATPKTLHYIEKFCAATGLIELYHSNQFNASHCLLAVGRCYVHQKWSAKQNKYFLRVKKYIAIPSYVEQNIAMGNSWNGNRNEPSPPSRYQDYNNRQHNNHELPPSQNHQNNYSGRFDGRSHAPPRPPINPQPRSQAPQQNYYEGYHQLYDNQPCFDEWGRPL